MKIVNPLTGNEEPIRSVLRSLAGQENCDGEPYDQMQAAADYIEELEEFVKMIHDITVGRSDAPFKISIIHDRCDKFLEHKQ